MHTASPEPRRHLQARGKQPDRKLHLHQQKVEHAQHLRLGRVFRRGGDECVKIAVQRPPAAHVHRRDLGFLAYRKRAEHPSTGERLQVHHQMRKLTYVLRPPRRALQIDHIL